MLKDIYVIKNTVNKMCYVGQSADYLCRFRKHKEEARRNTYKYRSLLYDAMNELGTDKFYVELLEKNVKNYDEREIYWINKLNTIHPNGYNLASGGYRYPNLSGVLHRRAKIKSEEDLLAIYDELQNGTKSLTEIGAMFGTSYNTIDKINNGETYRLDGYNFPLREFTLSKAKLDRLTFDLKYSNLSYREIAKLYGVSTTHVKSINYGLSWKRDYLSYPLRKMCFGSKSDADKITCIQKDLISTSKPLKDLAQQYGCSMNTIRRINNGESYHDERYKYPLRRSDAFLSQQTIDKIHNMLLYSHKSINDIAKFANVSTTTIKRINNGVTLKYRDERLQYPLRPL